MRVIDKIRISNHEELEDLLVKVVNTRELAWKNLLENILVVHNKSLNSIYGEFLQSMTSGGLTVEENLKLMSINQVATVLYELVESVDKPWFLLVASRGRKVTPPINTLEILLTWLNSEYS